MWTIPSPKPQKNKKRERVVKHVIFFPEIEAVIEVIYFN
jgi:hypothetical protein